MVDDGGGYMKKRFLNFSSNLISKYHPDYDEIKMEEIKYGLEGLYLTFTKLLIIIPLSLLLNIFKEFLVLLISFNILRTPAHGLHATKSWICLLSSTLIFIGIPLVIKNFNIEFPIMTKIIFGIISILLLYLYAPADTKKAPIIRAEKRIKFKIQSIISCILLITLSILIKNNVISAMVTFGILVATILILPITYKIFKLSYNNYKTYILNMD